MCVCVCVYVCACMCFIPMRAIQKYVTFSYSRTNMYRHHVLDAVYIIFVRNYILTSEKQI